VARAPASRCVPPWVVAGMMPTYGWGAPFPVYHVYPPPPHSEGPIERAASPPAGNPWALAQAGGRARPWMRLLSPQQFSTCHTAVLSMPFRQPHALRASPPPPRPPPPPSPHSVPQRRLPPAAHRLHFGAAAAPRHDVRPSQPHQPPHVRRQPTTIWRQPTSLREQPARSAPPSSAHQRAGQHEPEAYSLHLA
jgi:hypothetical protein